MPACNRQIQEIPRVSEHTIPGQSTSERPWVNEKCREPYNNTADIKLCILHTHVNTGEHVSQVCNDTPTHMVKGKTISW